MVTWITLELTELSEGTMDWLPTGTSAISMVDPECLNNLNNGIKYLSNTNVCENTPFNQSLKGIFIPRLLATVVQDCWKGGHRKLGLKLATILAHAGKGKQQWRPIREVWFGLTWICFLLLLTSRNLLHKL